MNKKILIPIVSLLVSGGVVFVFLQKNPPSSVPDNREAANSGQNETAVSGQANSAGGTASPVSAPAYATAVTFDCEGSKASTFDCYEDFYRNVVKEQGIPAAFADLKKRYTTNSYVVSQCHPITHILGQAATELHKTVSESYKRGDSFCWSGYYHGVMEGMVGKYGRSEFPKQLNTICSDIAGKAQYSFDYFNCVHGLGHGVMVYTNNELFKALEMCDTLTGSWEQSSCFGGVFMENVIIDNKNHFTAYLKPSDPVYPCNAVGDKYKRDCFLMQTSYMLKVTNGDFTKIFALCASVEDPYRPICYQSLGRDASARSGYNNAGMSATCALGKDETQISNCIIGAVKDVISYYHSDKEASELCDMQKGNVKEICHQTKTEYYKSF